MKRKGSFVVISAIAVATMMIGRYLTGDDMSWYYTLTKPTATPPGWVFSVAWSFIYACTALSAIIVWRMAKRNARFYVAIAMYVLNVILNVTWTYMYFGLHMQGWAAWHAGIICAQTLALAIIVWPVRRSAAWLLAPYIVWTGFATLLAYQFWLLNIAS